MNTQFVSDPEISELMGKLEIPPATIVSLMPVVISESKPGLYPGRFVIPAAKLGPDGQAVELAILVIGVSKHYVYLDSDRGSLPQDNFPTKVAKSVVEDFISASQLADTEAHPGLFYVSGEYSEDEIRAQFADKLIDAQFHQDAWFNRLIQTADDEWQKYRLHRVITDPQRMAARALGIDREWCHTERPDARLSLMATAKCPSCQSNVLDTQVVCTNCKCILKPEEYKKLEFAS